MTCCSFHRTLTTSSCASGIPHTWRTSSTVMSVSPRAEERSPNAIARGSPLRTSSMSKSPPWGADKWKCRIVFDILNFLNMLNREWGRYEFLDFQTLNALAYRGSTLHRAKLSTTSRLLHHRLSQVHDRQLALTVAGAVRSESALLTSATGSSGPALTRRPLPINRAPSELQYFAPDDIRSPAHHFRRSGRPGHRLQPSRVRSRAWRDRPAVDCDRQHRRLDYPYGGGLAKIIGESISVEATAEVTAVSLDDLKLIEIGKSTSPLCWPHARRRR